MNIDKAAAAAAASCDRVFANAGRILGLVACGLKAGRVELMIEPDQTRVFFTFRHKTDGGLILHDKYCMMFSALDFGRPGTIEHHAAVMLARFNRPQS